MEYKRLGKSGLQVSRLSFGSWVTFHRQLGADTAKNCMSLAYEHGVNFFDNAEAYENGESEKVMGSVLKELNWARDTYIVSSKVFWGGEKPTQRGLSAKHVYDACHAAMKRLQVDYLDLYYCHRPDLETPIEETVRAMHNLIQQGKILYWGTSEWSADQIAEAYGVAGEFGLTPPTMEQPQYNMFAREKLESEYLSLFENKGLGTTIWSPLASGILTGKYNDSVPEDSRINLPGYEWLKEMFGSPEGKANLQKVVRLTELAKELEVKVAQLAIAWCANNPHVSTVILGASRVEQLEETITSLDVLPKLTPEVLEKIETILDNKPKPRPRF